VDTIALCASPAIAIARQLDGVLVVLRSALPSSKPTRGAQGDGERRLPLAVQVLREFRSASGYL
jgi:hypothetical protein